MSLSDTALFVGLPMWTHQHWQSSIYGGSADKLAAYADMFNTVEGNTTFYATPTVQTVLAWRDATPADFRFTFKLPQAITHQLQLRNCRAQLCDFLQTMSAIADKTGVWKIQLPPSFGPDGLDALARFLEWMPEGYHCGVEVRHPALFAKGEAERAFNRLLMDRGASRIMIDTRPVFAAPADSPAVIDAHSKKPRVPVHALATDNFPVVRFIGHPVLEANDTFFAPWLVKLANWIQEGKQPYLFIHTPDNVLAPQLARRLTQQLANELPADIHLPKLQLASPQLSLI
ncbi:DUF72 domain-containing protein [Shewanella sp. GXUN23E]|uniref:DUF72 domain-containing protein n=1 Tax=Shewanella sp. GXUN23E TaxID=3422498 RepID=UPI003D7E958D